MKKLALLWLIVTAVYWNHFQNGFHFDDAHTVVDNPYLTSLANVPRFFRDTSTFSALPDHCSYRPLLTTTLAFDYWLGGGLQPFYFHLTTFLVFLLQLGLMVGLYGRLGVGLSAAWLAVAWYGVHPVNAETVNYVIQRGDVYSTCAVVAGLYCFLRWRWVYLVPVALGILVKPSAVMFAPILLVYLWLWGRSWRESVPAFVLCGALYVLQERMTGVHQFGGTSLWHHLLSQPWVAFHYVKSLFLPTELSVDADWVAFANPWRAEAVAGYLFVLACAALFRYSGRVVRFGIAWFFLALAPTSLVPLAEVTNDHRMYFPYVGLMLAVAVGLERWRRLGPVLAVLLLAYGWGTWQRNEVWRTEETLWGDAVVKSPGNGRALMNYGLALMGRGDYQGALSWFERAAVLTPNYSNLELNLGIARAALSLPGAEEHFKRGLALDRLNADPHFFYARWLRSVGRLEESARELRAGLVLKPDHRATLELLMEVVYSLRLWDELSVLVERTRPFGGRAAVMTTWLEVVRTRRYVPSSDDLEESRLLYQEGAYRESLKAAQAVLQKEPRSAAAFTNLAASHSALGEYDLAIAAARQAVALDPSFELARANLAYALRRGR